MEGVNEKKLGDYPKPVLIKGTEKILEQMKNNICKLCLENGTKGTGFFCKIPLKERNNSLPVLVTNNHLIDEDYLTKEKEINIKIND